MRRTAAARIARRGLMTAVLAGACLGALGAASAGAQPQTAAHLQTSLPLITGHVVGLGCAASFGDVLGCDGQAVSPAGKSGPEVMAGPTGLTPAQIQSAYVLNGTSASGRTVAAVDAYNDPDLAADLAKYRSQFGLPACTVAGGCLSIVNQSGKTTSLPAGSNGSCSGSYLCTAGAGYDGPTGLGTPDGGRVVSARRPGVSRSGRRRPFTRSVYGRVMS